MKCDLNDHSSASFYELVLPPIGPVYLQLAFTAGTPDSRVLFWSGDLKEPHQYEEQLIAGETKTLFWPAGVIYLAFQTCDGQNWNPRAITDQQGVNIDKDPTTGILIYYADQNSTEVHFKSDDQSGLSIDWGETVPITAVSQSADAARKLYYSDVLPRLRLQFKAIGLDAVSFGYAGTPDKTFAPQIGAHSSLSSAFAGSFDPSFPTLPVELLLDQAGKLIDRLAVEDTARRNMLIERFNLWLDLEEYEALDKINDQEIASGLYQLPLNDAQAAVAADSMSSTWHQSAIDNIDNNRERQQRLAGWATEVAQRHNPGGGGAAVLFADGAPQGYSSQLPETSAQGKDAGQYATDGWLGGVISYEIRHYQIDVAREEHVGQKGLADARLPYLKPKVDYYKKDVDFKAQRRAVAQLKLHRKIVEASRSDGILNYTPRIAASEHRILKDIRAAYSRLKSAKDGLSLVYDLQTDPLPTPGPNLTDDIIAWLREAAEQLQRISIRDQTCVLRVSLSKMAGKDFAEKLSQEVKFILPPSILPNSDLVRIRGASATFVPDQNSTVDSIAVRVQPPTKDAIFKYIGSDSGIKKDQYVANCLFGRVRSVRSAQSSDVLATQAWFNASPFGEWSVRQDLSSLIDVDLKGVADIYLDLMLVMQGVVQ